MNHPATPPDLAEQVARALAEDVGSGDLTAALVPAGRAGRATVITRESAVLCGRPWVDEVFRQLDATVRVLWDTEEGADVAPGQRLCRIEGPARSLLTGERTALNFLQTLSGTATATRRYASLVAGLSCRILDTRKTVPGLRRAQKYAVRCGGGSNHRMGLYDGILVKENHIMAAGSIAAAVAAARAAGATVPVEVEVETLDELKQALDAGADMALLDEFTLDELRAAVKMNREHAGGPMKLEASGNVTFETLRGIAETGVDFVSIGSLTKHVRAVDLSMRFEFDAQA
jgi:nicotinate-nucleotide pyrophosphorylase (carboxylating)